MPLPVFCFVIRCPPVSITKYQLGQLSREDFRITPQLLRFTESVRVEHIAVNCRSTWWHTVSPLLDWRSFDDGVTVVLLRVIEYHRAQQYIRETEDQFLKWRISFVSLPAHEEVHTPTTTAVILAEPILPSLHA